MIKKILQAGLLGLSSIALLIGGANACDQSATFDYKVGDTVLFGDNLIIGGDGYYTVKPGTSFENPQGLPLGGFHWVGGGSATFGAPVNTKVFEADSAVTFTSPGEYNIVYNTVGCASDENGTCLTQESTHVECYTYRVTKVCASNNGNACTKTSAQNSCGQSNITNGTYNCEGICTATEPTVPANPGNLGQACSKTSSANSCGAKNTTNGTYQCDGSCNATEPTVPANPGNLGQACSKTSAANNCSATNTTNGTYQCDGSCNASEPTKPADKNLGSCASQANNCGATNPGTYQCDGSCNATKPADKNLGVCQSVPNSCGQTAQGNYQCDGSCSAQKPSDSSCISCGDGVKNGNEACDKNDPSHAGRGRDGCDSSCNAINNPRYKCSNYQCIRDDSNGDKTSSNCDNSCGTPPVPKYKCNANSCERDDANGTYTSSTCDNKCVVVTPKYRCNANSCERDDANGTYTSNTCDNKCVVATPKYKCNANSCERDDANGTYTSSTCDNKCTSTTTDIQIVKSVDKPTFPNKTGEVITWTLNYKNNGPATAENVVIKDTLPSGIEFFDSLTPGANFSAIEILPGNIIKWTLKNPLLAGATGSINFKSKYLGGKANNTQLTNKVVITTTTPETNTGNNIGQAVTTPNIKSSLGDRVWLDTNGNGLQDDGEIGVNDVKVELRRCEDLPTGTPNNIPLDYNGTLVATTYTSNTGYYLFSGLDAGKYYVQFVTPNGYSWTTQYKDGYATYGLTNSNVNPVNGKTTCENLGEGQHDSTIDGGLILPRNPVSCDKLTISPIQISNSGTVTYNCTGTNVTTGYLSIINQSGNITNIYNLSGSFVLNTAGTYTAQCIVNSGITYGIKKFDFTKPVTCAYKQKTDGRYCAVQTSLSPYLANNINFSNLLALPNPIPYCNTNELAALSCVDAPANSQIFVRDENTCKATITVGAGTGTASVGDKLWFDNNKNGIQDVNEPGISGAKVELYTCSGSLIATTYTNASGDYLFDKLPAGNYKVKFYMPSGYNTRTTKNGAGSTSDNDSNAGNDGFTDCFTLVDGQNRRDIDAGVYYQGGGGCTSNCGGGGPTNYCGNGVRDGGEECDEGITNGYANSNCTTDCKNKTINPNAKVAKCDELDPPSVNIGEKLPFRRNMQETLKNNSGYSGNVFSDTCDVNNLSRANRSESICEFKIYSAKGGSQTLVDTITSNCFNTNNTQLIKTAIIRENKKINSTRTNFDGYATYNINPTTNIYGEYIIELKNITYKSCMEIISTSPTGVINKTYGWSSPKTNTNGPICSQNFTVTKPYAISRGTSISSIGNEDFTLGWYSFPGTNNGQSNVFGNMNIKSVKSTADNASKAAIDAFVDKYTKANSAGSNKGGVKVKNKEIYIVGDGFEYSDSKKVEGTIIVKGTITIKGNVTSNLAIIADKIIFKLDDEDCNEQQVVNGLYIAPIITANLFKNNDVNKERCGDSRLLVKGKLIGDVSNILLNRRSNLDGWFDNGEKYKAVINGAAIKIEENAAIWNIPGVNELETSLSVTK